MLGKPLDVKRLAEFQDMLQKTLDSIESVYLKDGRPYLCGDQISFADLLGVCELMQPYAVGQDVSADRPVLKAWMDRLKADLAPHFDDTHKILYKARQLFLKSNI